MKVILAGSSGFIGKEVLRQCLQNPGITSLVALSRRELPVADPKLKTVLVEDFEAYSPSVLKELEGAESCIWTLGVKTTDIDIQKKVTLDYTIAAADTFAHLPSRPLSPTGEKPTSRPPFRFVFASGILAVRDQAKSVWFGSGARHVKGEAENKVLDFSAEHKDAFDSYIVRPGAVLADGGGVAGVAVCMGAPAVSVQGLAAVMVELALKGGEEKVWENAKLVSRGRELLKGEAEK